MPHHIFIGKMHKTNLMNIFQNTHGFQFILSSRGSMQDSYEDGMFVNPDETR